MTRIQAVVFDLDGTLLDTIADLTGAINRSLAACGLPAHTVDECRGYVGGGIREAVRRALPPDSSDELIDRVLALYKNDYPHHCAEQTTWYPGVPELLERLARRGLLLGVLSNKTEATAQQVVRTFFPDVPFRCWRPWAWRPARWPTWAPAARTWSLPGPRGCCRWPPPGATGPGRSWRSRGPS